MSMVHGLVGQDNRSTTQQIGVSLCSGRGLLVLETSVIKASPISGFYQSQCVPNETPESRQNIGFKLHIQLPLQLDSRAPPHVQLKTHDHVNQCTEIGVSCSEKQLSFVNVSTCMNSRRDFFDLRHLASQEKAWQLSADKGQKSPNPLVSGSSGLICWC